MAKHASAYSFTISSSNRRSSKLAGQQRASRTEKVSRRTGVSDLRSFVVACSVPWKSIHLPSRGRAGYYINPCRRTIAISRTAACLHCQALDLQQRHFDADTHSGSGLDLSAMIAAD